MEEEEAREYYVKLQMLQQQLQHVDRHLEELDQKMRDLQQMQRAVQDVQQIEEGDELLVPLTNGIFLPVHAGTVERLVLNVGARTTVSRTPQQTLALLQEQSKELGGYRAEVTEQRRNVASQAQRLEVEIQERIAEKEGRGGSA